MRAVAPGVGTEQTLHSLFQYECARNGAPTQAYTAIVAASRNASTLHYVKNNAPVPSNPFDFMLVDAACEYELYASDITRTYPGI